MEANMNAKDVMTTSVISVEPDTPLIRAAEMMLQYDVSGFPVVDKSGKLVGIVTEGDFLRRAETGTERPRVIWLELLLGPGRLAEEYVHAHGRRVEQVMSREVITVTEDAPLSQVVTLIEAHRIKRVPVMREHCVVGIVSRRDLVHAFAARAKKTAPLVSGDAAIRGRILNELDREAWAPPNLVDITVTDGTVELRGSIYDERQRQAIRALAENVPGVKAVRDELVRLDPEA
jgi:CBS domain-containing protein